MNIRNYDDLISSPKLNNDQLALRKLGLKALDIAIESVRPQKLIPDSIKIENRKLVIQNDVYDLNHYQNIFIIGGGKATAEMANSVARLLTKIPEINYNGIINIQEGLNIDELKFNHKIQVNYASHPIPNLNGLNGTKSMIELIKQATEDDLIICLISGGGSALLPLPRNDITLEDLDQINSLLLNSGASIHEINTIRKHISNFKGGNLAKTVYSTSNATLICLIISDVIGNNLDSIASGPTVPDSTTFKDAVNILKIYKLFDKTPSRIKTVLQEGLEHPELENPKQGNICFKNVHNYLIGNVEIAVYDVKQFLEKHSYLTEVFSTNISGEAREFSRHLFKIINKTINNYKDVNLGKKIALVGSGELTVTITGNGIGGRNQEILLAYLDIIKKESLKHHFLIIAANLDGIEGNSRAMGALIDNYVLNQTISTQLDTAKYLQNNNSNNFFKHIGTEIITGPTGCNVNDLMIIILDV
ncbi:MAG: glycerate kinase [Candidatus Hermodarchaeota archaeon]